jgi:hypothetical protein
MYGTSSPQAPQSPEPSQSTPVPQNGCMIQGKGPLLQECPAYTCANINQDLRRVRGCARKRWPFGQFHRA